MKHPPTNMVKAWLSLIDYEASNSKKTPRKNALRQYFGSIELASLYLQQEQEQHQGIDPQSFKDL